MKKKITALVLVVAVLAMLFTGMTLAYFTDTDSAVNVFTVGDVDIELKETVGVTDSKDETKKYPEKVVETETGAIFTGIMPGNKMQKEVTVTNLENPAYVRVTVIVNNYDLINAMCEYYENKGYSEEQVQAVIDEVFVNWGLKFPHVDGDMRMTDNDVYAISKATLLDVDSTFTTKASDGSFHFSITNMFKTEHEEAQTGYVGGFGVYFEGGYYAQHLNDYELCYTYYLDMEKGGFATLFTGLACPAEFNQELAAMFNGLEIEIYAAAIQKEGFTSAEAAFEQLDKEYSISSMRAAVNPPVVVASVEALAEAIANGETNIALGANVEGDLTIAQEPDVNLTIDGNGFTFDGAITVDGKSHRYETAGLTIKNVNFNAETLSAEAYINLGKSGDNNTRYTNHVTIQGCTFSGTGLVAIKSYTGGDKNLTVTGCTVDAGMHSMLQVTNVEEGLTVTGCEVYSKNGINLNNTPYLVMSDCTFDVTGYAVRFGVNNATLNGNFKISNSTLKSACDDGDAVIIFRGNVSGTTLTLENTTLEGTLEMKGHEAATIK